MHERAKRRRHRPLRLCPTNSSNGVRRRNKIVGGDLGFRSVSARSIARHFRPSVRRRETKWGVNANRAPDKIVEKGRRVLARASPRRACDSRRGSSCRGVLKSGAPGNRSSGVRCRRGSLGSGSRLGCAAGYRRRGTTSVLSSKSKDVVVGDWPGVAAHGERARDRGSGERGLAHAYDCSQISNLRL